jgi:hypothetical protein
MGKQIKIWYDKEGDYLEVLFLSKRRNTLKKQKMMQ